MAWCLMGEVGGLVIEGCMMGEMVIDGWGGWAGDRWPGDGGVGGLVIDGFVMGDMAIG